MLSLVSAFLVLILGASSAAGSAIAASTQWIWLQPTRVEDDDEVTRMRSTFLLVLRKGNKACRDLAGALQGNRSLKAQMHRDHLHPNLVVVMIKGHNDGLLIRLAQRIGLPRGFPIIWDTTSDKVRFGGFLPKFSNDQDMGSNNGELQRIKGDLEIGLKFSGYLSMLMCVGRGDSGEYLMLATSKNSACCKPRGAANGLDFVLDAQRLWTAVLNTLSSAFFQEMLDDQYTICAEMLSKEDQAHGTPVYREMAVPTCVSQPVEDGSKFLRYMMPEERGSFLTRHGIWHPGRILVPSYQTKKFIGALCNQRDLMDLGAMRAICRNLGLDVGITMRPGTFAPDMNAFDMYSWTMGNVLEGLVMFTDGGSQVMKVKFPGYTWRTMLLRPWLDAPSSVSVDSFVRRWCTTDYGKSYYKRLFQKATTDYLHLQKTGKLARHLVIAEEVTRFCPDDTVSDQDSDSEPDTSPDLTSGMAAMTFDDDTASAASGAPSVPTSTAPSTINIVLILGPVGIGKSTTGVAMVNNLNKRGLSAVHIDGDELDLGMAKVLNLGQERAPYTIWKVVSAIASGYIPVISSGGGVFAKGWNDPSFALSKMVAKAFSMSVDMVHTTLVVPKKANQVYRDRDRVKATVMWRLKQGIWSLPLRKTPEAFAADIAKLSMSNEKFASNFCVSATHVVEIPVVDCRKYSTYDTTVEEMQMLHLTCANPINMPIPVANQDRLLAFVPGLPKAGHITLGYHHGRPQCLSQANWTTCMEVNGLVFRGGRSKKGPACWAPFPHRDDLPQTAHVTMNSGPHEPRHMRELTEAWINKREARVRRKDGDIDTYIIDVTQTGVVATIGPAFGVITV